MFEIGFSELLLVLIVGLVVLGPERLPVAVKTVAGWIRAMRSLAASVQNELTQELKLQELQETLKKVEQKVSLQDIAPELKESIDELRAVTDAMQHSTESLLNDEKLTNAELENSAEANQHYDDEQEIEALEDLQLNEDEEVEKKVLSPLKSDTGR